MGKRKVLSLTGKVSKKAKRVLADSKSDSGPGTVAVSASCLFEKKLKEACAFPMTKGQWSLRDALNHLGTVDPLLRSVIETYNIPQVFVGKDDAMTPYNTLVRSIVFQQLAGNVAKSIYNKLCGAIKTKNGVITPHLMHTARCSVEVIDGKKKIMVNNIPVGLSESKLKYILSLTEHFLDPEKLANFDMYSAGDDEIMKRLLAVKGLGMWSVQMFLIFHLHRADVLPLGDLAVRKGICKLYNLPPKTHESNAKNVLASLKKQCDHWSPYSSVGTAYMYAICDTKTI